MGAGSVVASMHSNMTFGAEVKGFVHVCGAKRIACMVLDPQPIAPLPTPCVRLSSGVFVSSKIPFLLTSLWVPGAERW